jgi:hypothetical protein
MDNGYYRCWVFDASTGELTEIVLPPYEEELEPHEVKRAAKKEMRLAKRVAREEKAEMLGFIRR